MKSATRETWRQMPRGRRAGFTLLEVLVALGIFAIGFVAIAAIFPVAVVMQRDANDDAISQQVGANAKAMLQGRAFRARINEEGGLDKAMPRQGADALRVVPLLKAVANSSMKTLSYWSMRDRSYGPGEQLPNNPSAQNPYLRRYLWVPLIRRTLPAPTDHTGWEVFVFVLRNEMGRTYLAEASASSWNLTFADDDGSADNPKDKTTIPHVVSVAVTTSVTAAGSRFLFNNRLPTFSTSDANAPTQLFVGDTFLDDNGEIHTVIDANKDGVTVSGTIFAHPQTGAMPTRIYYGMPASGTNRSPTCRILKLTDVVEP